MDLIFKRGPPGKGAPFSLLQVFEKIVALFSPQVASTSRGFPLIVPPTEVHGLGCDLSCHPLVGVSDHGQ